MVRIISLTCLGILFGVGTRAALSPLVRYHPNRALAVKWQSQLVWVRNNAEELNVGEFVDVQKYFIEDAQGLTLSGDDCECTRSLILLGFDIVRKRSYTFQVLDSVGKPESGLMLGNVKWTGRYHECMNVHSSTFDGKWCALRIGPHALIYGNASLGFFIGTCLPDTCSDRHLTDRLQPLAKRAGVGATVVCPVQPTKWETGDIISVVVFGLLVILVVLGTLVEFMRSCKCKSEALTVSGDGIIAEYRKEHQSVFRKVSRSFSIFSNTKDLLDTSCGEGSIDALHGIRFISITWVILGHTFVMPALYLDNFVDMAHWFLNSFAFQVVANATVAVDTFFCLSGLLVTYLTLRDAARSNGKINVGRMYLNRYLRLTPAYAMVILFVVGSFTKLGDGPMWPETVNSQKEICNKYWWTNLLYINNLYPRNLIDECFVVGWYLANDMQFFILAPIFITMLHRRPKLGITALVIGIIGNLFAAGFVSSYAQEQPPVVGLAQVMQFIVDPINTTTTSAIGLSPNVTDEVRTYWNDTYAKPWCRIGSYLVGILTGYLLHATNCKIKMSKIMVAVGWICAFVVNFTLVFGLWPHVRDVTPLPISSAAFFNAVSRPLWAAGLAWVTVACVCGYGGPVNSLLSLKIFIPLSRLTYCTYLIHTLVISWWFASREVDAYFSKKDFTFDFLSIVTSSLAAAYVLSMVVEAPISSLTKSFLRKRTHVVAEDEDTTIHSSEIITSDGNEE